MKTAESVIVVVVGAIALAVILQPGTGSRSATLAPSAAKVLEGARRQLINPARYDASYRKIGYPNGDVAADRGACSDVVVRALRHAGYDLQTLVHEDSRRVPYPSIQRRDTNIDHRRVRNLVVYFRRHGKEFSIGAQPWKPGDIVTWRLPAGQDHIGILSDKRGASGNLMAIHNLGRVAEEDVLKQWTLTGHYRFPKS